MVRLKHIFTTILLACIFCFQQMRSHVKIDLRQLRTKKLLLLPNNYA